MNVNGKLKSIRENKNISVNKLAVLSGVSQTGVREIELGNKQPTIPTLEKLLDALGITLADFFSDDKLEFTYEQQELIKLSNNLTPYQVEALINVAKAMQESK